MKIVIAIDSFKGSLSSLEAGNAVLRAAREIFPEAEAEVCPLADGGEGTVEAIVTACGGVLQKCRVCGPLGEAVEATYGILPSTRTAVIEMAAAAGLTLVPEGRRDPELTTTYGVGELILDAIEQGCRDFIIGIGGSATNDGGVGMLEALGFGFFDNKGAPIPRGAGGLAALVAIATEGAHPALAECRFTVACDVTNPLCGEYGCSAVFAPQKGASPEAVARMDRALAGYAALTEELLGRSYKAAPGAGAAGGMGFALFAYLGAVAEAGISLVMRRTALYEKLRDADLVITGEGRIDRQTAMGKGPIGIAAEAKRHGATVIGLCGCVGDGAELCNREGIDAILPILPAPMTAEDAMEKVRNGTYNDRVNAALPYPFRTGVVRRSVVWEKEPEWKEHSLEGLTDETFADFKNLMSSGMNDEMIDYMAKTIIDAVNQ